MIEASESSLSERSRAQNRRPRLAFVLQTLSRAAFLGAAIFLFLALIAVYRLWVLSTSQMPSGFPLGWLFELAGTAVSPFKDTETQVPTKETGYIEFPSLVALEVFLVSSLMCAILGYFLSLFVHVEKSPQLAAAVVEKASKPRIRPLIAAAASGSARALRGAEAAGIAVLQRPEWAEYRASTAQHARSWSTAGTATARRAWALYVSGVRRDWEWMRARWAFYVSGVKRDAAWLSAKWAQGKAAAGPRYGAARDELKKVPTRTKLLLAASGDAVGRKAASGVEALSSAGQSAGRGFERATGWYWSNFDAASNRFAGMASRLARREQIDAESLLLESVDAESEVEEPPLSRREFLRKVMPNR